MVLSRKLLVFLARKVEGAFAAIFAFMCTLVSVYN